jgi:hypothetical protein
LLLLFAGCGGHGAGTLQPVLQSTPPLSVELRQALKELDALPVPEGADPAAFAALKDTLRKLLIDRGTDKFTSAAPGSSRSKVTDLTVQADGAGARFHWSYRNEGDFNQEGIVNVSDLTTMGINYGKDSAAPDWATARAADGNENGKVDLPDLVSIGANFLNRLTAYDLQRSDAPDPGGTWTPAAQVPFAASSVPAGELRQFDFTLDAAPSGYYRVVPCDGADAGVPSDPVEWTGGGPATHYETEDNDDYAHADPLPAFPFPAPLVDGNLGVGNATGDDDGDSVDWFTLSAAGTGTLAVTMSYDEAGGNLDLYLYKDPQGAPLASSTGTTGVETIAETVQAGVYYLKCELVSGHSEYALAGAFTAGPPTYYETEDNDAAAEADVLPAFPLPAGTVTGNLGAGNPLGDVDGDFTDWFTFGVDSMGTVAFDLYHDTGTGDLDLYLYQDPLAAPLAASETDQSPEHVEYYLPQVGTYYLRCARYLGYSEYTLEGSFEPDAANHPPQAQLSAGPLTGEVPLTVSFDAGASSDPDPSDAIAKYEFDFGEGAGYEDFGVDPTVVHNYNTSGDYTAMLRVTDNGGLTAEDTCQIQASNPGAGVWNVLIWMAADNNLASEAYGDIQRLETAGSTDNVRVLLGYDVAQEWITGSGCEAVRFIRVVQDSDPQSINYTGDPANTSFPEVGYDSSHPQHVLEFLQWAQQFPAEHSLLVLWDHGNGWRQGWKEGASARAGASHAPSGMLKDDADGTADLTNNKWIVDMLAAYHFDILLLDACNMGHMEAVYDFHALADRLLASEALLPGQGLPYDGILSAWNAGYPLAPDAICQLIADESYTMYNGVQALTLAVLDASAIIPLTSACAALAGAVEPKAAQESLGVRRAISLAYEPRAGDGERDLHHFLTIYRALTADAAIQGLVDDTLAQWDAAAAYFKKYGHPGATGLSVFLPSERFFDQTTRDEYGAAPFNQATGWLDMLVATGVPGQAGLPGVEADWAPGDRVGISWSDAAAEVDLSLQGPATNWASPIYPVELSGVIEFSADNPTGGATAEWGKLLPAAPAGDYTVRLDWFSYSAGAPPALLDVAAKLYDGGGMLKQDLGTCQIALNGTAGYATLHY